MRHPDLARHAEKRELILEAALGCFMRHGFHGTSMQEVCQAAGMSPGNLYRYFRSKTEIIAAIIDEDRREFRALFDGLAEADDFIGALETILDRHLELHCNRPRMALWSEMMAEVSRSAEIAAIHESVECDLRAGLASAIDAARARGQIAPIVDTEMATFLMLSLGDGICTRAATDPNVDLATVKTAVKAWAATLLVPRDRPVPVAASLSAPDLKTGQPLMTHLASLLAALGLGAVLAVTPAPASAAEAATPAAVTAVKPPTITVVKAERRDLADIAVVSGTLVAREEVLVTPEIEGLAITEILVEEGARVEKGQVLARLSRTTLDTLVAQNAAQVARAEAGIAQAKASIAEADAARAQAELAFSRATELRKTGTSSVALLDNARAQVEAARARADAARQGLAAAEADRKALLAQGDELKLRLARTEIKAPTAGVVSRRDAKLGAIAAMAAGPLFRMIENGDIELEADVPETVLAKLKAGQKVAVTPAGFDRAVDGTVRLVSPEVNRQTRLGRARVALAPSEAVKLGAFARGEIELSRRAGVTLPLSSVVFEGRSARVQIVADGKVSEKQVTTGLVADGRVEIASGIVEGEQAVLRAGGFVRDGDAVTPVAQR